MAVDAVLADGTDEVVMPSSAKSVRVGVDGRRGEHCTAGPNAIVPIRLAASLVNIVS